MRYINLPKKEEIVSKKLKGMVKKFMVVLSIMSILVLLGVIWAALSTSSSAFRFIFKDGRILKSDDEKINVLLLGNAGGIHDGAYLTDTIMVASFNLKNNHVYLISLPRDLWLDNTKSKLNTVYEIGQEKGNGLQLNKTIVSEILGIPIHYAVRVDFRGFVQAVDQLKGIDVLVDNSFDDYLYPIAGKENDLCGYEEKEMEFEEEEAKNLNIEVGKRKVLVAPDGKIATDSAEPDKGFEYFKCRYEYIGFKTGLNHMDGEVALKYVRSRMGTNGEGNDFARSKRQQKVLESFKMKVLSFETLVNPAKISQLLETFGKSIEIDIPIEGILEFYKLVKNVDDSDSFVLSNDGKGSLLYNPLLSDYGGAWVLIPKAGNFDEIHQYVGKFINGEILNNEATTSARTR